MLDATFLIGQTDAGARQTQAVEVARKLGDFIGAAQHSLDIAIYDFRLSDDTAGPVIGALNDRAERGVAVRVAYFQPRPRRRVATEDFAAVGADPAPPGNAAFLSKLSNKVQKKGIQELDPDVTTHSIDGMSHLMHDKYIVRDADTLWTGSTNFTDDAFSLQENNIVTLQSPQICALYLNDFEEMWRAGTISNTGKDDTGETDVDGVTVDAAFSPGQGRSIDMEIASRVAAAKHEVKLACMVLSSAGVLGALVDAIDRGVSVSGVYDATQMAGVVRDWRKSSAGSQQKIDIWNTVQAHLVGKNSTPYTDNGPHDFMHNKVAVIDEAMVVTGSFNFSNNATMNAENVLFIADAALARRYAAYIDEISRIYGGPNGAAARAAPARAPRRSGRAAVSKAKSTQTA